MTAPITAAAPETGYAPVNRLRARNCCARVVLVLALLKVDQFQAPAMNPWMSATNALVIGSINAAEA